MMNWSLPNDQRRGRRRVVLATVMVVCIVAIDHSTGGGVGVWMRMSEARVWVACSGIMREVAMSGFFSSRRSLMEENAALRSRLALIQDKAARCDALEEETNALRAITHLVENAHGITAPVVSSWYSSPYGTFMIGAGLDDGVMQGSLVLSGDAAGFVVGRVVRADARSSLVMETFAHDMSFEATIAGASVLVHGKGGYGRAAVPRGIALAVGDAVRVPAYGGRMVGVVSSVHVDAVNTAQDVYIALPSALDSLTFVYVVFKNR